MIGSRSLGEGLLVLSLAATVAGCQTAGQRGNQGGAPPIQFAQAQGWYVERVIEQGQGASYYCAASRVTNGPDIAFFATATSTGVLVRTGGAALNTEAPHKFTVAFDGGGPRALNGKAMGPVTLAAPLGGTNAGAVLGAYAGAGSVTVQIPAIGLRQRFDLNGSSWAISKLSECMYGRPAVIRAPTKPADTVLEKRSATAPANEAAPHAAPVKPAPGGPASAAPASGGVDLDEKQPTDLDSLLPKG